MRLIVSGGKGYNNLRRLRSVLFWLKPSHISVLAHPAHFAKMVKYLSPDINRFVSSALVPIEEVGGGETGLGKVGHQVANLEMLNQNDGLVVAFRGQDETTSVVIEALKQRRSVLLVDGGPKRLVEMLISNHEFKIIQDHQDKVIKILRQQNADLRLALEVADEE